MLKDLRSLFGGKTPAPADPRELFAAEVQAFLRSMPKVTAVKRASDAFAFDLTTPGGKRRMYLDNLFAESREMSPEQRREKIAFFFLMLRDDEQNDTWEAARETFVPVLRGATFGIDGWMRDPRSAIVRRSFLPFIDEIVAMDRPTSMSFVGRGTVDRWEVGDDSVFEAAAARAPLLANPSLALYDETHGPLWIVTSNDSYESSRLVVPGWLASFRGRVEGEASRRHPLLAGAAPVPDVRWSRLRLKRARKRCRGTRDSAVAA
jgi:hypothetical protein